MRGFRYFRSKLKSHIKSAPTVIAVSFATALAIAILAFALIKSVTESDTSGALIKIGVTGDLEQRYIDIAVDTMNNLDDSRFSVEFLTFDEEGAADALSSGSIVGYIIVPPGFTDGAARAEFIPVTFVTEGNEGALVEAIVGEFLGVAERVADETQRSTFGADRYMAEHGVPWEQRDPLTDGFALEYASIALKRNTTLDIKLVGERKLSTGEYYFSAFVLLFALLFGVGCASHVVRRDESLPRLLSSNRVGALRQTVSETGAFFIFSYVHVAVVALLGGFVITASGVSSVFGDATFGKFAAFALGLAPAILMIASAQLFLYECARSVVPGVLLQFVAAITTAYVSGFFYPSSFFPITVRKIADNLPGGVAFTYAKGLLTSGSASCVPWLLGYTALFLLAAAAVRRIRIGGDES